MLISCPECKKKISSRALFCPTCGRPTVWRLKRKVVDKSPQKESNTVEKSPVVPSELDFSRGQQEGRNYAIAKLGCRLREETGYSYDIIRNILGVDKSTLVKLMQDYENSPQTFGKGFEEAETKVTKYAVRVLKTQGRSTRFIEETLGLEWSEVIDILRDR